MRATTLLVAALLGIGAVATAGQATPGSGTTGETLAQGVNQNDARADLNPGDKVVVRRLVIEPGGTTGWHRHDGTVLAVVQSGTLTRTFEDCRREISRPGQAVTERPGDLHTSRNTGRIPLVLFVTYVLSPAADFAKDADAPDC